MLLYYCDKCGMKVNDDDLQAGRAVRDGIKTYCSACVVKDTSHRTTVKARPVSGSSQRNRQDAAAAAPATSGNGGTSRLLIGGLALGGMGLLMIGLALSRKKERVEPAPVAIAPVPIVAPPVVPQTTPKPPVLNQDPPTPSVDLTKRSTSTPTPVETTPVEVSRGDREKALDKELEQARAERGAKVLEEVKQAWNGRPDVKSIVEQYKKLEEYLDHPPAEIVAAQTEWERKLGQGVAWTVMEPGEMSTTGGSTIQKATDNVVKLGGTNPLKDDYTISATTELKEIAALRLEVLSDPAYPSNGPGRTWNGNFVLTRVKVSAAPKGKPAESKPLKITAASADYSQPTFPAASLAQEPPPNGWAIDNQMGKPHVAVFNVEPARFDGGAILTITLEHQSVFGGHNIGALRLAVTSTPGAIATPPDLVAAAQVTAESRTPEHKKTLARYFRDVSPELKKTCDEMARLYNLLEPVRECRRKLATLTGSYRGNQAGKDAAAMVESNKDIFQLLEPPLALPARGQ